MSSIAVVRRSAFLPPLLSAAAVALASSMGRAQEPSDVQSVVGVQSPASAPTMRAVRTRQPIVADGRLDEAAWQLAPAVTGFTQVDPQEGAPASERTEVRVLYDDEAVYVGARLHDRGGVRTRLGRRDAHLGDSDEFSVAFDSYHDRRTAFRFRINPSEVRGDEILSGDFLVDPSWDPVWEGRTSVSDSGWVAELRIPLSQLRFARDREQVWGVQLARTISRTRETVVFSFSPKSEFGGISRYGELTGLEDLSVGRRLEVLPYAVARTDRLNSAAGDPFRNGADYGVNAGVDLKYRVTSNLTLDATLNPDFGQAELDPAEINLTPFETFFQERRPFFVEGADVFSFGERGSIWGGSQLLYSRRIGRAPIVWPDGAAYVDQPDATTILGAAKLTGKSPGGWSVGLLTALTGPEDARYADVLGARQRARVEPLSNYLAARVKRDLRAGASSVGGMVTAVHRDLDDPFLATQLRSSAHAGGLDVRHEWARRAWALNAYVVGSRISGEPVVVTNAQRSSARYFQRPDATHLRLDTSATSLIGYAAHLSLGKQAGRHWRGGVELNASSPGFETNDLGFQTTADRVDLDASLRYVENRPGRHLRHWRVDLGPSVTWNHGGDRLDTRLRVSAAGQLPSYWGGSISLSRTLAGLDDRLTRGGPLARAVPGTSLAANVQSDARRPVYGFGFASLRRDDAGARTLAASLNLGFRHSSKWSMSVGPTFSRSRLPAQYVTARLDSTASHTFGRRYVFADLDQTTLGIDTRLNLIFTPYVSLEMYVQPFFSSGDYGQLKELRAPRTFAFDRYGIDVGTAQRDSLGAIVVDPDGDGPARAFPVREQDFNLRSLRGNAVLRWEWRPGSTLFVVWQHRRSAYVSTFTPGAAEAGLGEFHLRRDIGQLFRTQPDNVLLVKLTYWLNP